MFVNVENITNSSELMCPDSSYPFIRIRIEMLLGKFSRHFLMFEFVTALSSFHLQLNVCVNDTSSGICLRQCSIPMWMSLGCIRSSSRSHLGHPSKSTNVIDYLLSHFLNVIFTVNVDFTLSLV